MTHCPVCDIELKTKSITVTHRNSPAHQKKLSDKGYTSETDPTLPVAKAPASKGSGKKGGDAGVTTTSNAQLIQRIERLEIAVQELSGTVQRIVQQIKPASALLQGTQGRTYSEKDVRAAISTCLKSKAAGERWVSLDDVVGVLKASGSGDRETLYKVIADMFYADHIDLAEGGNPKYPLRIQGNAFGMIAIQNGT